ncbi:unnamed protein product [Fusarium fujikuroi]|nr:unnamed protein product [Fusarium fujikuroi]
MHVDELSHTHPWGSHLTPESSPMSMELDDFTDYGTNQALAYQYDTKEQHFSLDSCFESFFESEPDFSSSYELPDLSQRAVSPSKTSLDRAFSSEVAGYDFSTAHTLASPIWPSDGDEHPGSFFKLSDWQSWEWHDRKGTMFAEITEKTSKEEQRQTRHRATSDASKKYSQVWTFRRNEHLKRHMKTLGFAENLHTSLHREAPESFFCEFCGKNGFSRRDNLRTHRKLHARQPSRKCRVRFIPAAALLVHQEMHGRNLRVRSPSACSRLRPRHR